MVNLMLMPREAVRTQPTFSLEANTIRYNAKSVGKERRSWRRMEAIHRKKKIKTCWVVDGRNRSEQGGWRDVVTSTSLGQAFSFHLAFSQAFECLP